MNWNNDVRFYRVCFWLMVGIFVFHILMEHIFK